MTQQSVQGQFIWQGLMTEDPAGASAFYAKVVGWRAIPSDANPAYTLFAASSGAVAGLVPLTDALREQGVRGHWLGFIAVDDLDAMTAKVASLGGKIIRPVSDNGHGQLVVVADPQGAGFALFKPKHAAASTGVPKNGEFSWQELATSDPEAALKFYSELFGWQLIERMDMGAMGYYWIFGADGVQRGGIWKLAQVGITPHWLPYAAVADADKAAAATTKAGGSVVHGPANVPGGRIVQLTDPSGVAFAVHAVSKSAPAAPSPKPAPAKKSVAKEPVTRKAVAKKAVAKPAAVKAAVKAKVSAKKAPAAPKSGKSLGKSVKNKLAKSANQSTKKKPAAKKTGKKTGTTKAVKSKAVKTKTKAKPAGKARSKK